MGNIIRKQRIVKYATDEWYMQVMLFEEIYKENINLIGRKIDKVIKLYKKTLQDNNFKIPYRLEIIRPGCVNDANDDVFIPTRVKIYVDKNDVVYDIILG